MSFSYYPNNYDSYEGIRNRRYSFENAVVANGAINGSFTENLETDNEGLRTMLDTLEYQRLKGNTVKDKTARLKSLIDKIGEDKLQEEKPSKKKMEEILEKAEELLDSPSPSLNTADPWQEDLSEILKYFKMLRDFKGMVTTRILREDPEGDVKILSRPDPLIKKIKRDFKLLVNPLLLVEEIDKRDYKKASYVNKKGLRIVLIDDSGSMSSKPKPSIVKALLYLLADTVAAGDELLICLFESDIHKRTYIKTHEEALKYIKNFEEGSLGGTEIGEVLKSLATEIKTGKVSHEGGEIECPPDTRIILVNDGQDYIPAGLSIPVPVTAAVIQADNPDLRSVVEASGGQYNLIKTKSK